MWPQFKQGPSEMELGSIKIKEFSFENNFLNAYSTIPHDHLFLILSDKYFQILGISKSIMADCRPF